MTEFTDPRSIPGFKSKFVDERIALLLGAILDQLKLERSGCVVKEVKQRKAKPTDG